MEQNNTQERRGIAEQMQLFAEDVQPIEAGAHDDRQTQEKISSIMKDIRERMCSMLPPSMLETAEAYGERKVPELKVLLLEAGIGTEPVKTDIYDEAYIIDFIVADYVCALAGATKFYVPEEYIEAVVNVVSEIDAVSFDMYGFYFGVYARYKKIAEVNRRLKAAGDDKHKRIDIFREIVSSSDYYPVISWLIHWRKIEVSDFMFLPPGEAVSLIETAKRFTETYDFIMLYCIAKGIYLAGSKQLSELRIPEFAKRDSGALIEDAERMDAELRLMAQDVARHMRIASDYKVTQQQREKAVTDARQAVHYPKILSEINRKDIYFYADKPKDDKLRELNWQDLLPIDCAIKEEQKEMEEKDRLKRLTGKHYPTALTAYNVQTAIEAAAYLTKTGNVTPVSTKDGMYGLSIKTNLTEFAVACGYVDAGQDEKLKCYHALRAVRELVVAVFKPSGKIKPCRILDIPELPTEKDHGFEIFIYNSFWFMLNRSANIIDRELYTKLMNSEKSNPELHFRNAIINGAKEIREEKLLDDVFSYTYIRSCIEAKYERLDDKPELLKLKEKELKEIGKHKDRDKRKLKAFFDKYADLGAIKYSESKTKDGKKKYIITKLEGFDKTEGLIAPKKQAKKLPKDTPKEDEK